MDYIKHTRALHTVVSVILCTIVYSGTWNLYMTHTNLLAVLMSLVLLTHYSPTFTSVSTPLPMYMCLAPLTIHGCCSISLDVNLF